KQKRNEEWALVKKQEQESAKKKRSETRKLIWSRAKQYAKEYDDQQKELISSKREAKLKELWFQTWIKVQLDKKRNSVPEGLFHKFLRRKMAHEYKLRLKYMAGPDLTLCRFIIKFLFPFGL
ncbi:hypothetical protein RYX36_010601, partial [Vicia faba]